MTDKDPDQFPKLADLNVDKVRAENDHVDNRIAELESKVSNLQSEVATLEDEKSSLEDKKEAAEQLLAEFHDSQREEQLARIREANEAVAPEDEVDLEPLEEASVDQLTTVANMVEKAAAAAGQTQPTNANRRPELSNADPQSNGDIDDLKAQAAKKAGLGELYEKAQNDAFTANHQQIGDGVSNDLSAADIEAALNGGDN